MDVATPAGIFIALAAVVVSMIMEGGDPMVFVHHPAPIVLVVGGTLGVSLACNRLNDVGGIVKAALRALLPGKKHDEAGVVRQLVQFADVARRDGLLALEEQAKQVTDPFLKRGLELVIDGSDPELVHATLEADIDALKERHKVGAKFFADMGAFAPTLGIIGTVLGLVHMLENLSSPDKMGPLIAAAFIATLWGVMLANLVCLPIAGKLKRASAAEVAYRELVLQGVLSIQAGGSPRAVGERLKSHLPPKRREAVGGKAEERKSA